MVPAIRAWLSLVGMPNHQAPTAKRTIAVIAPASAAREWAESTAAKLTRPEMVSATSGQRAVMATTPSRFMAAARVTARL